MFVYAIAVAILFFVAGCVTGKSACAAPCPTQDGLYRRTTSVDTVGVQVECPDAPKNILPGTVYHACAVIHWGSRIDTTVQWEPVNLIQWEIYHVDTNAYPDTSDGGSI